MLPGKEPMLTKGLQGMCQKLHLIVHIGSAVNSFFIEKRGLPCVTPFGVLQPEDHPAKKESILLITRVDVWD